VPLPKSIFDERAADFLRPTGESIMMQWRSNAILLLLIFCCFSASSAFAACHAVSVAGAGSKNGVDWSDAYAGIPGTLVRGDTYYFADGSYGSYQFQQSESGTSVITFKKAQSYDFGRSGDGCSNDISAGWNAGTMGASQAVFSGQTFGVTFLVNNSYFTMNGNGTSTAPGCGGAPGSTFTAGPPNPKDCGFKLDNHSGSANKEIYNAMNGPANANYSYVEIAASGVNADQEIFGPDTGPTSYTHIYAHNSGCVYFQDGGDARTVSYSYFNGTETNGAPGGACHGQYSFEAGSTSNGVEHHNVYKDITGTAVFTFANTSQTHNNWVYYDNVIFSTSNSTDLGHLSDGVWACINGGTRCTNFLIYQNTIINQGGLAGINDENGNGSYTVRNNLWYKAVQGVNFNGNVNTQDHNSFLAAGSSCPSGSANVCNNSAANPFTNWPGSVFTLASDSSDWNNRILLGSPFTTDTANVAFSTDRGAYQFTAGGVVPPAPPTPPAPTAPAPPTNLVGIVR
jgi:hypothetical protein